MMGAACEEIIALASRVLTDWEEELVQKVNTIGAQIDESERTTVPTLRNGWNSPLTVSIRTASKM